MSPGYKGGNIPPHIVAAADAYVAGQDAAPADAAALHAAFVAGAAHVQGDDAAEADTGAALPPA